MKFNVLGPVSVVDGGRRIDIGGPKQRAVLAALVARAGDTVSADTIAQAVYGDDVPDTARRRVQVYVSTLRGIVGDAIVKDRAGWALRVDEADVDHLRFVNLYDSVRSTADLPAETRSRLLREALALWSGHPYAGIENHGFFDAEIARLDELRKAVLGARLDADLELGRHAELVGEIEALLAEHPFVESFRAQHMVALYRSGRQREALHSFSEMRTLLAEEVGVDPTPELRDLEGRILQHDDSLDLAPPTRIRRTAVLAVDFGDLVEFGRVSRDEREAKTVVANAAMDQILGSAVVPAGTAAYRAFDDVTEAVRAAERLQLATDGDTLRVAIDHGDVQFAENGLGGAPVQRAATLVSVAHPGQVLLSAEAQHAATSGVEATGFRFEHLGSFHLPGVDDPTTLHQLLVGDDPAEFPPPATDRVPARLPEGPDRAVPGYELREPLGPGSAGTLYRGYQPSVGREVIVEVVSRDESSGGDFIRRFEADAHRLTLIDHPNINRLLDHWREPTGAYLVHEHHRGGFLSDTTADAPERIVQQVGAALAHAHSAGLVHGSIRPDRILLDETGNAYLLGFPVAGVEPPPTSSHHAYVAPEIIGGEPPSQATDQYSFAVLAHEVLTGHSVDADQAFVPDTPAIVRATDDDPASRFDSIDDFLAALFPDLEAPAERFTDARNPYKGLAPFHEADAADFHGRTDAVAELIGSLRRSPLVTVVGPSGAGKSSVVRAGLVPALRQGAIDGSDRWLIVDLLPGSHPFLELERAIRRVAVDFPGSARERFLANDPDALSDLDEILPDNSDLLVVIDQFEELFTLSPEPEAAAFLALIGRALDRGVRFVLTMRADFLDRPLQYPEFAERLRRSVTILRALDDRETAEAIVGPAAAVGVTIDGALAERIVADVGDQPGALPLMQFCLAELFRDRSSDLITTEHYDRLGGLAGSVAQRVESIYTQLDQPGRHAAKQLFLRLVRVGSDTTSTRHRVRLPDLADLGRADVIDAFARNRLLVFDSDPESRAPTVEIAHEALLEHWPRLAGWIDATRQDLALLRRLDDQLADWEAADRSDGHLLTGDRLVRHQAWTETTSLTLPPRHTEYLERSTAHDDDLLAGVQRRRRLVAATLVAAAVVAAGFGLFALVQAAEAESERRSARSRELAASATAVVAENPELSTLLALQAADVAGEPPAEALDALFDAGRNNRLIGVLDPGLGERTSVDVSSDGTLLVTSSDQGVSVFETGSQEQVWTFTEETTDMFMSVFFSPDDSMIAVEVVDSGSLFSQALRGPAEADDHPARVLVLDAQTGEEVTRIDIPFCPGVAAAWSPNGEHLALTSDARIVGGPNEQICERPEAPFGWWFEIYDTTTWESVKVVPIEREGDFDVGMIPEYDASGRLFFFSVGSGPQIFSAGDYELVTTMEGARGARTVTPDGRLVAAFNPEDGDGFGIWDTETSQLVDRLQPVDLFPTLPRGLTFSDDGELLIAPTEGDDTLVWNMPDGDLAFRLPGGRPQDAVVDTGNELLYTGQLSGEVKIWRLGQVGYGMTATDDLEETTWVNGNSMSIGDGLGAAVVWDISAGEQYYRFFDVESSRFVGAPMTGQSDLAVALPGNRFAYSREAGDYAVFDVDTATESHLIGCENDSTPYCVDGSGPWQRYRLILSLDGTEFVAAADPADHPDGFLPAKWVHFDPETLTEVETTTMDHLPNGILRELGEDWALIEPTESLVAADRDTGEVIWKTGPINNWPEVSPSGRMMAVQQDNAIRVVELETWDDRVLPVDFGRIRGISFSQDDAFLAIADDQRFWVIDLATDQIRESLTIGTISDAHWYDSDTMLIGTSDGFWGRLSLNDERLIANARERVTRSFTPAECSFYRIDPCPTLEEIRSG